MPATARALDAYFIVGAEHGFNASTFTARVMTSTRSDIASAVAAAIGTMKGPLHGGAPSEVVDQLNEIGSAEHAEAWVREALDARRAADGLRPSRLPGLRPAGRRAAQGRRGDGATGRTGSQLAIEVEDVVAAGPRREAPGAGPQDQRRVLRGAGPAWASA